MRNSIEAGAVLTIMGLGATAYCLEKNTYEFRESIKSEVITHQERERLLEGQLTLQRAKVVKNIQQMCHKQYSECLEQAKLSQTCQSRIRIDYEDFHSLHRKEGGLDTSFSLPAESCYIEVGNISETCKKEELACLKK